MKILALDIGAGTQDILLFDEEKNPENCVKIVLPSPSKVFAEKIREATRKHRDLFIKGEIIGGGPLKTPILNHIKSGGRVFMAETSAFTLRNNLEEVESLGIKIVKNEAELEKFEGVTIELREINLDVLNSFLEKFNEKITDVDFVAVGVQDSGVAPPEISNRKFRLQKLEEFLRKKPLLESLAFGEDEVPSFFLRMKSAVESVKKQLPTAKVLVMDTAPAAILGCLKDPVVEEKDSVLVVNMGNAHTLAVLVHEDHVCGMVEHHTRMLKPRKAEWLLENFKSGSLTDDAVYEDGGHGLFYLEEFKQMKNLELITVTGPNRNMLRKTNLKIHFAAPIGDMMMTGPVGLVEAVKRKFIKK
ncbi:hypothetical protein DRO26_04020 [Candidatus Bathyarchaeota archaeon]|nr:MAG: hypothetical protein DRO26_04020 [Candidatus Bathyarchaeota archaeon]